MSVGATAWDAAVRILDAIGTLSPAPAFVLDSTGPPTILAANRSAAAVFGVERSLDGAAVGHVLPPTVADDLQLVRAEVARTGRPGARRVALPTGQSADPLVLTLHVAPLEGDQQLITFTEVVGDDAPNARVVDAGPLVGFLKELARITTQTYADLGQLLDAYLDIGRRILGLDIGIISRISEDRYEVEAIRGGDGSIEAGQVFALGDTYCAAVADRGATITYSHVGELSSMRSHPAYEGMKLESYVGAPVFVKGLFYGTLNFSSPDVRNAGFLSHEVSSVELMAENIGRLIASRDSELAHLRARRDLVRTARQLRDRNRELENFASVVAHDLKSPLTSVRGFAETLERHAAGLDDGDRKMLDRIVGAADRMTRLIDDLLILARAGGGDLQVAPVDLADIVDDAIEGLETELSGSNGEVVVEGLPTLHVSASMIEQLFTNLIGNAIKYRRPDVAPRIVISATEIDAPAGLPSTNRWWAIEVRDNGRGFREADLDRVFAAFDRLDQTDVSGTGVGIPICKRVAERHGGELAAHGVPGEGATFTVILPERPPAE